METVKDRPNGAIGCHYNYIQSNSKIYNIGQHFEIENPDIQIYGGFFLTKSIF